MTVRLSVNINTETESALKEITARRHARWSKRPWFRRKRFAEPTVTTTLDRAVACYKLLDDASFEGKEIQLVGNKYYDSKTDEDVTDVTTVAFIA